MVVAQGVATLCLRRVVRDEQSICEDIGTAQRLPLDAREQRVLSIDVF